MTELEDFLAHHGVKGMRWGVRNKRSRKELRARAHRSQIKKRRRTLSDSDLKAYIARIQEERKLKELINEDLAPGKTAVKKIMTDSGQKIAKSVVFGVGAYGAGLVAQKALFDAKLDPDVKKSPDFKRTKYLDFVDPKDFAEYVRGNKPKK